MLGSLKLGGYLIAALAFLWLGWTVNNWRVQAARLPVVEADLVKERNTRAASERARKEADDARTLASLQLETYRERTEDEIALLKSRVPVLVNNSRACAFSRELVGVLNDARRGGDPMPTAPRPTVGGAVISASSP